MLGIWLAYLTEPALGILLKCVPALAYLAEATAGNRLLERDPF